MIMMVVPARQSLGQCLAHQPHHHMGTIERIGTHTCEHKQLGEFLCVCVDDENVCDFIHYGLFSSPPHCAESLNALPLNIYCVTASSKCTNYLSSSY